MSAQETRIGRVGFAFVVTTLCVGGAGRADAVDLVNRDRVAREAVVNRADGSSETITVGPGQRLQNICDDCVILVGMSSVETRGRTVVRIERGEVSIEAKR